MRASVRATALHRTEEHFSAENKRAMERLYWDMLNSVPVQGGDAE